MEKMNSNPSNNDLLTRLFGSVEEIEQSNRKYIEERKAMYQRQRDAGMMTGPVGKVQTSEDVLPEEALSD